MAMLVPALPAMATGPDTQLKQGRPDRTWCTSGYSIDFASRFLFPGTFILFAAGYWLLYMYVIHK